MKPLTEILAERKTRWAEIAKMAGVSYTTIWRIAKGKSDPLKSTHDRIRTAAMKHRAQRPA